MLYEQGRLILLANPPEPQMLEALPFTALRSGASSLATLDALQRALIARRGYTQS